MYGQVLGGEIARGALGTAVATGSLPFTGLSIVWWLLLGATLMVVGASLLRTSHVLGRRDRPEPVPGGRGGGGKPRC
jgi:hypothetical protein